MDIVDFVRARLDEDEWWAREASRCREDYTEAGEHWRWESSETDEVVAPDPAAEEFMQDGRGGWGIGLRSVEQYPYRSLPATGPHMVLKSCEEVEPAVAGHIARHDPARVLREVEAKRRIVDLHSPRMGLCDTCATLATPLYPRPCPTLSALLLPYSDHPDYDPAWRP